jgi:2-polyprenyl-3-methyl-5-hydroxy-6-metoxy-1,4-benzoquinol methylase
MKMSYNICPLCSKHSAKPVHTGNINLLKCADCGIVFNSGFRAVSYDDNYFQDDYRKQYGKTYIEDFDNIYRYSIKRLEVIDSLLNNNDKKCDLGVLDIGSAAGFFLKAARDRGFGRVTGIEISEYASEYCRREFNIDVVNSSFEHASLDNYYDVITAWYFVEHNPDPGKVIGKIYSLLNDNGIFAFSVPSIFGPQYIFKKENWILSHPVDHRIDFSPASVKMYLGKIGFKKVLTVPAGIHPERIYLQKYPGYTFFSLLYKKLSELTSFSDTLEVYAVK